MSKRNPAQSDDDPASKRQNAAAGKQFVWHDLLAQFGKAIDDVDMAAAAARVDAEREAHADDTTDILIERLIREKCMKTGTIGAVTSGAALVPGIGTVASLTFGVAADIGATFKLQAELVLEIAAAHRRMLTNEEKRAAVLLITGMSGGANQVLAKAGEQATIKLTERYAQKWLTHALPLVGVAASAATNVLTTYLVGKRADAYFRLGSDAIGDWGEIWRAITGVDERAVGTWFTEQANASWHTVRASVSGAGGAIVRAGEAATHVVSSAGGAALSKASDLADSIGTGVTSTVDRVADAATSAGSAVTGSVRETTGKVGGFIKRKKRSKNLPEDPDTQLNEV